MTKQNRSRIIENKEKKKQKKEKKAQKTNQQLAEYFFKSRIAFDFAVI